MRSTSNRAILVIAVLTMSFVSGTSVAIGQTTPTLSVNAGSVRQAINPDIYGMLGGAHQLNSTLAAELKVPNVRFGGDAATRYNWTIGATCDGADFWFVCQSFPTVDSMVTNYRGAYSGTHILSTIPIIPWIASTSAATCSYPVSVYGAQQSTNVVNGVNCGNGVSSGGSKIVDSNLALNMTANNTTIQRNWVTHLVATFGSAASGGVNYYQLDNEPGGWSNTHRDAEPTQPDYGTITTLGESYATAIKSVDPTAKVFGPSDFEQWGWCANNPSGSTTKCAGQYYLQQFAAYDAAHGSRTLDCFDEHYIVGDSSSIANSFAQVRNYWDTTYNPGTSLNNFLGGPLEMIPRFQNWVATYYPGTCIAMSEYEVQHTGNSLADALVLADALGVFGYYGLQLANLYDRVNSTDPEAYTFRMYRNYDGAGSQFGDTSVSSISSDATESQLSVYGATRSSDKALTIMVINKTASAIQTSLSIANFDSTGNAAIYTYSNANVNKIVLGTASVTSNSIQYSFPGYSATLFILTGGAKTAPAPPTGLAAQVQ